MNISAFLKQLAELEGADNLYQHDEKAWSLFLPDGQEIYIDAMTEKNELVFSCDVSLEPVSEREAFYQFLLRSNHAWREQDFCFLALSEDGKFLTLIRAMSTQNLEFTDLAACFKSFNQQRQLWKKCTVKFSQFHAENHSKKDAFEFSSSTHIRV